MILSREECHCNPLMLLSHPQCVWVSVAALIYKDSGWRKWSLSSWLEGESERASPVLLQTTHKRFYNAFTMSAHRWHIGNQSQRLWCFSSALFLTHLKISPLHHGSYSMSSPLFIVSFPRPSSLLLFPLLAIGPSHCLPIFPPSISYFAACRVIK